MSRTATLTPLPEKVDFVAPVAWSPQVEARSEPEGAGAPGEARRERGAGFGGAGAAQPGALRTAFAAGVAP